MTVQRHALAPARRAPRDLLSGVGTRVVVGVALLLAALGLSLAAWRTGVERDQVTAQISAVAQERDQVAQDARDIAGPQAALCAAGGDAGRALAAAGLCDRARQVLSGPVVQTRTSALTAAQIDEIVAKAIAQLPQPATADATVDAVLDRLGRDPRTRGLTEDEVRAIVASAVPPVPADGRPGAAGSPGTPGTVGAPGTAGASFGGLRFERRGGHCTALVTFVEPTGAPRVDPTPVADGVCDPPPVEPPPDPAPVAAPPSPTREPDDPPSTATPAPDEPDDTTTSPVTTGAPPPDPADDTPTVTTESAPSSTAGPAVTVDGQGSALLRELLGAPAP